MVDDDGDDAETNFGICIFDFLVGYLSFSRTLWALVSV